MRYVSGMDEPLPGPAAGAYVLAAHPNWRESRVNKKLLHAARGVEGADVQDLYAAYPDYDIDVQAEQRRVSARPLLVLLHPIQWYSMPALMKLWLDDVLTHNWAYGHQGTALQGKDLWLVATTGGPEASYHPQGYNRYFFDAFLPPYEQTAALCGMRFLPPLLMHGANRASAAEIDAHVAVFADRLRTYPDWPEMDEIASCVACEIPTGDRPVDHEAGA